MRATNWNKFLSRVPDAAPDACWEWQGTRQPRGYGRYGEHQAHRMMWTKVNGPIPGGLVVMHTCDNPPCVNPAHLALGTQAENLADMRRKGRHRGGTKPGMSPTALLTEEQVRKIKAELTLGKPYQAGNAQELADRYGVSKQTIYAIGTGRNWSHVSV